MPGLLWKQYLQPSGLAEALQALSDAPGPVCPIAGGTDLLLDLRQGHHRPVHTLVDVSGIADLTALGIQTVASNRGGGEDRTELFIGAAVSHSRVIHSALVNRHAQALAEACDLIGGPQVRNVATLGGNVAHALPAADGAIALLALDALAVVASLELDGTAPIIPVDRAPATPGESVLSSETPPTSRHVILQSKPLRDLYLGPGKTALSSRQLLVGFYIPLSSEGQGSAFKRVMRDQGVALPVLNVAVWLARQMDQMTDVRIAIGPAGPTPLRALETEALLRNQAFTPEILVAAQRTLLAEVSFRTSPRRATSEYRQQLAGQLLVNALHTAWERANLPDEIYC